MVFKIQSAARKPARAPVVTLRRLNAVNKALVALINECLDSGDPSMFATCARLCEVGQELRKAVSLSANDHESPVVQQMGVYQPIEHAFEAPGAPRRMMTELMELLKETIKPATPALPPLLDDHGWKQMSELQSVLNAKQLALSTNLPPDQISIFDRRIEVLLQKIDERNKNVEETPEMVSAVLVRGHPTRAQGSAGDRASLPQSDAEREGGAALAARQGGR